MARTSAAILAAVLIAAPVAAQPIIRLEARSTDGGILLLWEAAPEGERLGFHVFRQERGDTSYARITEQMLTEGPVFEYLDREALPVLIYVYEMEATDRQGRRELSGGVSAMRSLAPHLTLSATQASPGGGAVRIAWASDRGLDHLEFYVHRARGTAATRLHAAPIPGDGPLEFVDAEAAPDTTLEYRLEALWPRGAREMLGPVRARTVPRSSLGAVEPNPWRLGRRAVRIHFSLAGTMRARIRIFDAAGRFVGNVLDGAVPAGDHVATWDGPSTRGAPAVYFLRLDAGSFTDTRKLVVID